MRSARAAASAPTVRPKFVYAYPERNGGANRGTFLVDRDGVVRFAEMNGPGEPRDQDVWRNALAALTD